MFTTNWLVNKIGVVLKLLVKLYYDFKFTKSLQYFSTEFSSIFSGSYKTQSIDYLLLIESLKFINFKNLKYLQIADIGCGTGRLIAYLNDKNSTHSYFGYEINPYVCELAKSLFMKKKYNVQIIKGDVLEHELDHDLFILFNPFTPDMFRKFLKKINGKKSKIQILYINASSDHRLIAAEMIDKFKIQYLCINKPIYSIIETNVILMTSGSW